MDRFAVHSLYRNRNRNRTPQSKPQRWLCGFCCFVFVVVAVLFAVLEVHHLDRNRNRNRILFSDMHCNRNRNHILFSHLHRNRNRNRIWFFHLHRNRNRKSQKKKLEWKQQNLSHNIT